MNQAETNNTHTPPLCAITVPPGSGPNIQLLLMTINFRGLLALNEEIKKMSSRGDRVGAGAWCVSTLAMCHS